MKEDQSQADWVIIARYLDGECADREIARARELVSNDPALLRLMEARNLSSNTADAQQWGVNSAVEKIVANGKPGKSRSGERYSDKVLRRWGWYTSILTAAFMAVVSWQAFRAGSNNPATSEAYKTYTTKSGQRASLTLADGSHITLGPATILRVQKSTTTGIAVEVNGEALFNVAHSARNSFTVTAHGVATRVLGTEFIVRAYDPSLVRVAVRDGRVSVQSSVFTSANAAIVNSGEAVTATPNALPVVTSIKDIDTDFAWARGELVMRDVPLGDALIRLSRWYGMDFRVTDPSLLQAKVNVMLPSEFNPADIDVLASVINATARRSGNAIILSAKAQHSQPSE